MWIATFSKTRFEQNKHNSMPTHTGEKSQICDQCECIFICRSGNVMCATMLNKNPSHMIGLYVLWLFSQILDIIIIWNNNVFRFWFGKRNCITNEWLTEEIIEKKEQKVKDIAMDMSLSVQRKCFKIIIWLHTFMFHNTDYQPPRLLHLYGRYMGGLLFFRSIDIWQKQIHFFKCIKAMVDWTNFISDVCADDTRRQLTQLCDSDNGWQQIVVEMEESYFYSRT